MPRKSAPPAQAAVQQPVRPVQAVPVTRPDVRKTIQHSLMQTVISGAAAVLVFTGQPANAGETLYAGNKSYEAELEALIASRNAKLPEFKEAPSVAEPTKKREPPKEEAPSVLPKLSDIPLKLSEVPKTLLETPSSVPEPDPVPAAPFEQPSVPTVPYPAAPGGFSPPSFFSAPEPPKAELAPPPPPAPAPPPAPTPPPAPAPAPVTPAPSSPPQAASPVPAPSIPLPSVPAEAPSGPSVAIGLGGIAVLAAAGFAVANGNSSTETPVSANGAMPATSSSSAAASSSPPEDPALAAKENAKEAAEWIKKWRQNQH